MPIRRQSHHSDTVCGQVAFPCPKPTKFITGSSHDGGTIGFTAEVGLLPDDDLGIVVLTNGAESDIFTQAVQARLFELALGEEPASDAAAAMLDEMASEYAAIEQHLGEIDPATVAPVLGHYTNPALGNVDVTFADGKLTLDAGEARSALLPYLEGGEVVTYVAAEQPLTATLVGFDTTSSTPVLVITDSATNDQFVFSFTSALGSQ